MKREEKTVYRKIDTKENQTKADYTYIFQAIKHIILLL